ncbi:ABC transporter permease [Pollutibacter soli]|uniref:ABC transporter permease n=1 Tax=Pollutibacter soli TaxID=3034157 RepID=UPI003013517B
MFRHYFKTAVRIFWKQKAFSLINIIGLALSMAVCLLLIMLVKDANQFDLFHKSPDRIYRINTEAIRKGGGTEGYASSPYTVMAALTKGYSGIEHSVMLSRFNGDVSFEERKFSFDGKFTDEQFFSIFGFTLKAGQTATSLAEPFSIVLTNELSEKLFPSENPVGKMVDVTGAGIFKVTGVLDKFPGKTHLEFDALMSFSSVPVLEKKNVVSNTTNNWLNYYTNYSYLLLNKGTDPKQIELFLTEIAATKYKDLPLETRDAGYRFKLQSLQKITPGPMFSNNMGRGVPSIVLWFISLLALVIIVSAAFNYTNLTIAKAVVRTREIALRKVVGSSRWYIFLQVLSESIITSLISLLVAFVILQFLIPSFTGLSVMSSFDISLKTDPLVLFYFVLFAIITGLFAGILPATVLSRVKPLMLLQKLQHLPYFRRLGLRKVLLIIQFLISLIFINMVHISYKQMQHGMDINFGSSHAHIFNINLQGQDYAHALQEFSKVPGVGKVSAISTLMGNYSDRAGEYRISKDKDPVIIREYVTDENYISNFDLKLLAGKNFPSNPSQQHEQYAIVNEKFIEHFQLGSPIEAVGKTVLANDSLELTIIGVLKDFIFKPQEYALAPMVMRYDPTQWNYLNISLNSSSVVSTVAQLGAVWKALDPYHQFNGRFYEEEVQAVYAGMRDITRMVAFIGFLGMVIACLGLLGITMFTVQSKTREISIRKVVGAGPFALVKLLSRSYFQVILISLLIAIPVVAILGNLVLQSISQRIEFGPGLFVPGVTVMLIFSALTVGSQTIRAAFVNPVNGLREE